MNRFFCPFRTVFASACFTLFRLATFCTLVILNACDLTPGSKLTAAVDFSKIGLPAPSTLSKVEIERLRIACEAWYDSVLKSNSFNGGIVVAKKGTIVFEAYNTATVPANMPIITDSTSLHIASVSKTFTGMAVLKLMQDGKCNLDDEFSKYFPSFNYSGVTVRSLLNHRSGLPNYVHFMENMGWDKKVNITNQDVFDFLVTRKAEIPNIGPPNRGFTYCNTNFALLALLIEKLSGKKYGDYLQETFFTPYQMKHTFVYDSADSGKVLLSYDGRGRIIPMNFLDRVYGDKNVYSTPRDLLTWDKVLTSGLIFTPNTLTEAYAPYSNEKPGIRNYGLGWRMNNYPNGTKMIYHNGWWHGNNAAFIRLLADSATIVVLGNKENHAIYHAKDLAAFLGNYSGDAGEDEQEAAKPAAPIKPVVNVSSTAPSSVTTKRRHIKEKTPSKKTTAKKPAVVKKKAH